MRAAISYAVLFVSRDTVELEGEDLESFLAVGDDRFEQILWLEDHGYARFPAVLPNLDLYDWDVEVFMLDE